MVRITERICGDTKIFRSRATAAWMLPSSNVMGRVFAERTTGVMCPSYQATREGNALDPRRANLLRAMIGGPRTTDDGPSSMVHGLWSFDKERVEAAAAALDLVSPARAASLNAPRCGHGEVEIRVPG